MVERTVYCGGPIDYASGGGHTLVYPDWRHLIEVQTDGRLVGYCPVCANSGDRGDDLAVMTRNSDALRRAEFAVFDLSGGFTVGTPVEIEWRAETFKMPSSAIVHRGSPGLFVRRWVTLGATLLESLSEVGPWLRARL